MQDESTLVHRDYASERTFESVVTSFEAAVGSADKETFAAAVEDHSSPDAFIRHMQAIKGSSDFMLFLKVDHGAWLPRVGLEGKAIQYTIGNPLIAQTMIRHNIQAALNVPVRVLVYEDPVSRRGRMAYDLPSSLMARLKNAQITAAARLLDEKLAALATHCTGSKG
ncbi:MAG TPA: DUF302 domain-containing protein [Silvibacterium sp.]|nr:DUF302 domain-containing protein [Silvibacterium sp.]